MADPVRDAPSQNSEDEDLAVFDKVSARLQLQNLPALALQLRNREAVAAADATLSFRKCHVVPDPLYGSHHILFKLEFDDGVRWLLKVPANGYPDAFDTMSACALRSEALTMGLIRRNTKVPVPEIYHFDDTLNNDLCCPFILMEYLDGRPLYEIWFDRSPGPELLERRRCRALEDVARAVVQLNKFVFSRGGALLFNGDGVPCGIGPERTVDMQATLDCITKDEDFDGGSIFCTVGPFSNAKSWFTCMLDRWELPPDEYGAGVYKLLRLFIDLLFPENGHPKVGSDEQAEFILSHPDFDIQNVVVSEDGSLLGLIDWDGAGTVPRCLGNEAYPSWLTRDWDEMKYRYDENATPGPDCLNNIENSPSELEHYRGIYQNIIEDISDSPCARRIACNSLLVHNFHIAAADPVCTHSIMERVFKEIKARTDPIQDSNDGSDQSDDDDDDDDFYPYEVFTGIHTGEISERNRQRLIRGFHALLV